MPHIVVVPGSVRTNSVNEKLVAAVTDLLAQRGIDYAVAAIDQLPFFDAETSPTSPGFPHSELPETVVQWTRTIDEAAGVIFICPEYNHNLSAVQKNAIDWIGAQWETKPVALMCYGWSGGRFAQAAAAEALGVNLKAVIIDPIVSLTFTQHINPDGSILAEGKTEPQIQAMIEALLNTAS